MRALTLSILLIGLCVFLSATAGAQGPNDWLVKKPKSYVPYELANRDPPAAPGSSNAPFQRVAEFVVVGSGAGGGSSARIISDAGFSVIVLEAGDNYADQEDIWNPLMASTTYGAKDNKYGWQLKSEVEAVTKRAWYPNIARMFGGSTSHNGMQYARGSKAFFDRWAAYGGATWSTQNILDAYTRLENYTNEQTNAPQANRGVGGPVNLRRPTNGPITGLGSIANKLANWSAQASGIPITPDYNGLEQPYGPFPRYDVFQTLDRKRVSSVQAFLGPDVVNKDGTGVNGRKIRVFFKATVTRVLFDKKMRAVGVEVFRMGRLERIWATKEVILAANFQSATILQQSGVGNATVLASLGIPVVYDNPNVGLHATNHPGAGLVFTTNPADGGVTQPSDPQAIYGGGGFYPSVKLDGTFEDVDVNKPRMFQTLWLDTGVPGTIMFFGSLIRPVSTGKYVIQSNDPLQNPSMDDHTFEVSEDIDNYARFFYHFVQNNFTEIMHAQDPAYNGTWQRWTSVEETKSWLIANSLKHSHFCSTNRMSPDATTGVVDYAGRVHGVTRVRVADTSVIPEIPDGTTAPLGMLVGMRIGEMIVAQYSK